MSDVSGSLSVELEATTASLRHRVMDLQQDLTKLQQMLGESSEEWSHYQFQVWTQGAAAHCVAEIASLLSRQHTLQEVLARLSSVAGEHEVDQSLE